jgi:hypothetical protein
MASNTIALTPCLCFLVSLIFHLYLLVINTNCSSILTISWCEQISFLTWTLFHWYSIKLCAESVKYYEMVTLMINHPFYKVTFSL